MTDLKQFHANWNYPTNVRQGLGRISKLPQYCKELGMKAPLLVTDPGLVNLPIIKDAHANCVKEGLRCEVFSKVVGNPTDKKS